MLKSVLEVNCAVLMTAVLVLHLCTTGCVAQSGGADDVNSTTTATSSSAPNSAAVSTTVSTSSSPSQLTTRSSPLSTNTSNGAAAAPATSTSTRTRQTTTSSTAMRSRRFSSTGRPTAGGVTVKNAAGRSSLTLRATRTRPGERFHLSLEQATCLILVVALFFRD